jgi:50S ribosomal protein L16 3-hydroxylase
VRHAERVDAAMAAVARRFADDLPGEAQVQLFATPAGTYGFGWHWDWEDVFIAQTAGDKEYVFRDNTVDRTTPRARQPDFGTFRRETSPLASARLLPGDWLYIPARWWHVAARCHRDALSLSVGMFPDVAGLSAAARA